jgi:hypothetical protein
MGVVAGGRGTYNAGLRERQHVVVGQLGDEYHVSDGTTPRIY